MNSIRKLFDILFDYYGPQDWWPCQTGARWEIITGAILTQNTAWTNVEKSIGNLLAADVMSPERVLATPDTELQELRRPGGFATALGGVRRSGQKKRERRKNAGGSFSPTTRTSVYQSLPHFSKFRAVEPFQPPGGDVTFFRCDRSLPLFLRQRRRPGG